MTRSWFPPCDTEPLLTRDVHRGDLGLCPCQYVLELIQLLRRELHLDIRPLVLQLQLQRYDRNKALDRFTRMIEHRPQVAKDVRGLESTAGSALQLGGFGTTRHRWDVDHDLLQVVGEPFGIELDLAGVDHLLGYLRRQLMARPLRFLCKLRACGRKRNDQLVDPL